MSRVKVNEVELARVVSADAIAKIRQAHGGPAQFALATKGIEARDRAIMEQVATDAVQGLGRSLNRALQGYDPATNHEPNITLQGHGYQEALTPSAMGAPWQPLALSTQQQKAGGKVKQRALESRKRTAILSQSKRPYWWKIWRHRRETPGLYSEMRAALAAMSRAKVKFVRVSKSPTKVGTTNGVMSIQYVLVFPTLTGAAGALLNAWAIRGLVLDSRMRLTGQPPFAEETNSDAGVARLRHPERQRPLIRPLAVAAGRRLDTQLRRLRK